MGLFLRHSVADHQLTAFTIKECFSFFKQINTLMVSEDRDDHCLLVIHPAQLSSFT